MMPKTAATSSPTRLEEPNLDGQYGKIGISAVAAALHFACEKKMPVAAEVKLRAEDCEPGDRWIDLAAA